MEVEWRNLRADELRQRTGSVVIVPVASLEQHGPHLPVEVDSRLGETIAVRTARKMVAAGTDALVLPVIWTGLSEHHMSFGGTITLDLAAFAALVECICRSLTRHGFRRIALLNAHGGNENALRTLTDELTPKLGVPILQFTYWYAAAPVIAEILETQTGLRHACEAETSMMMALQPECIAHERIPIAQANRTADSEPGLYRWRTIAARSSSGVLGNPEAASAAKGERLLAAISERLAETLCRNEIWERPWQTDAAQ